MPGNTERFTPGAAFIWDMRSGFEMLYAFQ
jgi:hypothetical protein